MKREAESALASVMKPMKREDVTDLIVFRKMKSGIKWPEIAKKVGASKEWTAAACLGGYDSYRLVGILRECQAVGQCNKEYRPRAARFQFHAVNH